MSLMKITLIVPYKGSSNEAVTDMQLALCDSIFCNASVAAVEYEFPYHRTISWIRKEGDSIIEQEFVAEITIKCPFCSGTVQAGFVGKVPTVTHTIPPCQKFVDATDPTEFLKQCNDVSHL